MSLRRTAALGAVAVLSVTLGAPLGAAPGWAAVPPGAVRMSITDVSPNSPALSHTPRSLQIALTLTNTTGQTLRKVTVSAARGDPIGSQRALDAAIARPAPPSESLVAPLRTKLSVTLSPHATVHQVFRTKTDIPNDTELCLCANAIYPLYFTAEVTGTDGVTTQLGTAQTYLPSFTRTPAKTPVGWLWPLLDRPHRLTNDRIFTDDALAGEVGTGGRLDQLLTVVENVSATVPMTLVTDPDLIDELAVMAGGPYRVTVGTGATAHTVAGTGTAAAGDWLQRLRTVLDKYPKVELDLTPFADPAVESLTRNRLTWQSTASAAAEARVADALRPHALTADIAWPAGGTLSASTLARLVSHGTRTVVLSDRSLTAPGTGPVPPDAVAPLETAEGHVLAGVTSSPIERWIDTVLQPGGSGLAALPQLVAELAIRVVTSMDRAHYVLLAPERDLTVDPAVATRAIIATAGPAVSWATALPLRAAAASVAPVDHGRLHPLGGTPSLPAAAAESLHYVTATLPGVSSLYWPKDPGTAAAKAALATLPIAMQRTESTSLLLDDPQASTTDAQRLERRIRLGIRAKVHLVEPSDGAYTLTSRNSQLPITVVNQLPIEVQVQVHVIPSVPGLSAPPRRERIKANSKIQLRIPTHSDRVGRIVVHVTLSTPAGLSLGRPIRLTVRSTALGTVGVLITVAAGIVLALALLVRLVRRLRRRRRPPPPRRAAEPAPATTAAP